MIGATPWPAFSRGELSQLTGPVLAQGLAQMLEVVARFDLVNQVDPRRDWNLSVRTRDGWGIGTRPDLKADELVIYWDRLIVYVPPDTSVFDQAVELHSDRSGRAWLHAHVQALAADLGLPADVFRRPA